MEYIIMGLVCAGIGLFSLVCALVEAKWFFNNYKARRVVDMLGFKFAKGLYVVIGILLIAIGAAAIAFNLS